MTTDFRPLLLKRQCPECDGELFHPGPSACGTSINIKCANCGKKYWYSPPFMPHFVDNDDSVYNMQVAQLLVDIAEQHLTPFQQAAARGGT